MINDLNLFINHILHIHKIISFPDKPGKPQGPIITKEIRRDRITIEWKAPIDDGGLDIEKYTIEKCETAKMNWIKVADVDKDIESFCIQKLQLEVEYMFRVIAKNIVGASEPLESESVKTRMSYGKYS